MFRDSRVCKTTVYNFPLRARRTGFSHRVGASMATGLRPLYCPWPPFWVPLLSAALALLQRRVGRMSNPPVAPSVAASKQKSAYVETCFKGTETDANNA